MSGVNAARGPWRAGLPGPAWPRHDDLTLLTGTSLAFALGVSSAEGAKHLIPAQAGILAAGSRGSGTAAEHSSRFPPDAAFSAAARQASRSAPGATESN